MTSNIKVPNNIHSYAICYNLKVQLRTLIYLQFINIFATEIPTLVIFYATTEIKRVYMVYFSFT